eukprot:2040623-Pleurochrysis_carterae.AAC.1
MLPPYSYARRLQQSWSTLKTAWPGRRDSCRRRGATGSHARCVRSICNPERVAARQTGSEDCSSFIHEKNRE